MAAVTILGAGVMGSAMAMPLRDNGHAVRLAGTPLDGAIIDEIRATGRHPKLNVTLPEGVAAFHHDQFAEALGGDTEIIVLGVSSAGVGWAIDKLNETLSAPAQALMITKGLWPEPASMTALPDLLRREVRQPLAVAAVGGPCIAGELAARRATGTVIVAHDAPYAARLCAMLETAYYHPRASTDVIGVEVNAAFKNFFAIAVGWAAGRLEALPPAENAAFNHNAAAVLFNQSIRELMALTRALGGNPESAWGMPGAGDLYVTAMAGRNARLGNALGRGLAYRDIKDGPMKGDTIEGAELGLAAAPSIHGMIAAGTLREADIPLTMALLKTLVENAPLEIDWRALHSEGIGSFRVSAPASPTR